MLLHPQALSKLWSCMLSDADGLIDSNCTHQARQKAQFPGIVTQQLTHGVAFFFIGFLV